MRWPHVLPAHVLPASLLALVGALPAAAGPNLLENGSFDHGLAYWTENAGDHWKAEWGPIDAGYDIASGSARLEFRDTEYSGARVLGQCLPVTAGTEYLLSGLLRIEEGSAPARVEVAAGWFTDAACSPDAETASFHIQTEARDAWVWQENSRAAPPGTVAAGVWLLIHRTSEGIPAAGRFDSLYFGVKGPRPCTSGPEFLCLDDQPGDKRFEVQVNYSTTQGGGYSGVAVPVPLNAQGVRRGGVLWFFEPDNPEMLIKVLAGCDTNGHYWVFYSVGTNVHFTVHVRDTLTDQVWTRSNPDVHAAPPVQDTKAFPCAGG